MTDSSNDPRFVPGDESPAWLAALGEADAHAERHLEYRAFLDAKQVRHVATGFTDIPVLNKHLFDWQGELDRWALRRGSAALWLDCGLGKTLLQLDWARIVHERTNRDVLIAAPLAVSGQTQREATKFGIEANEARAAERTTSRDIRVVNE